MMLRANTSGRGQLSGILVFSLLGVLGHISTSTASAERPAEVAAAEPQTITLAATRAREVLHRVLAEEKSWKMIHAAEAMIQIGDGSLVLAVVDANQTLADNSDYRIGAWRVRARLAETLEERSRWIEKIEAVLMDPASADRLDAIETLAKLNCAVVGRQLAVVRQLAAELSESDATFALWTLAVANEPGALGRLAAILTSAKSEARGRAAYALRWLRPSSPQVLRALAQAADNESPNTGAYPYILSAAVTLNADPLRMITWQSGLERVLSSGETSARYEACQSLMFRYTVADAPRLLPLLEDAESDTRTGAAWSLLFLEARSLHRLNRQNGK